MDMLRLFDELDSRRRAIFIDRHGDDLQRARRLIEDASFGIRPPFDRMSVDWSLRSESCDSDNHKRMVTSFHEAGHALAAHAQGFLCRYLSAVPGEEAAGLMFHDPDARYSNRQYAIVLEAGRLAQARFCCRCLTPEGHASDTANAEEAAIRECGRGEAHQKFLRECAAEATGILTRETNSLNALAQLLYERGRLDGSEIWTFFSRY